MKNTITRIKDIEGNWQENETKNRVIIKHFTSLFTEQNATIPFGVLDSPQGRLSEKINSDLTRAYEDKEIEDAQKHMSPLKVSGPDGMSSTFY